MLFSLYLRLYLYLGAKISKFRRQVVNENYDIFMSKKTYVLLRYLND